MPIFVASGHSTAKLIDAPDRVHGESNLLLLLLLLFWPPQRRLRFTHMLEYSMLYCGIGGKSQYSSPCSSLRTKSKHYVCIFTQALKQTFADCLSFIDYPSLVSGFTIPQRRSLNELVSNRC